MAFGQFHQTILVLYLCLYFILNLQITSDYVNQVLVYNFTQLTVEKNNFLLTLAYQSFAVIGSGLLISLDEKMNPKLSNDEHFESKGFMEAVNVTAKVSRKQSKKKVRQSFESTNNSEIFNVSGEIVQRSLLRSVYIEFFVLS